MKKTIRLSETELSNLIKRIVSEQVLASDAKIDPDTHTPDDPEWEDTKKKWDEKRKVLKNLPLCNKLMKSPRHDFNNDVKYLFLDGKISLMYSDKLKKYFLYDNQKPFCQVSLSGGLNEQVMDGPGTFKNVKTWKDLHDAIIAKAKEMGIPTTGMELLKKMGEMQGEKITKLLTSMTKEEKNEMIEKIGSMSPEERSKLFKGMMSFLKSNMEDKLSDYKEEHPFKYALGQGIAMGKGFIDDLMR